MFGVRRSGASLFVVSAVCLGAPVLPSGCGGVNIGTGGAGGAAGAPATVCGNGVAETPEPGVIGRPEECDGADLRGYQCTSYVDFKGGTLGCDSTCRVDFSGCIPLDTCGNGVVDEFEECDGALFSGDKGTCPWPSASGTVRCNQSLCRVDTSGCVQPVCGNGVQEPGEECDGAVLGNYSNTPHCSDVQYFRDIFGVMRNYLGGSVQCSSACRIDLSECIRPPGCYPSAAHSPLGPGIFCF